MKNSDGSFDNVYERLDYELDVAAGNQVDWCIQLQSIRARADEAYNTGELAMYQWRALVTRSAKIQDMKNGD